MSHTLIVAEKPSVARDIARVVGATRRHDGFLGGGKLDGREVRVTWCVGHLVQLVAPEHYDTKWKHWRFETLPMIPPRFALEARKEGGDQWQILQRLLVDPDLERVVNACDAGREGELIFAYVREFAGCHAPVARLWVSSMTDAALRDGLAALRPGPAMQPLEDAARARSEADWLVGLNATRALTLLARTGARDGPLLSVGRVQTPTLAILVKREEAIEAFVPVQYWQVETRLRAEAGSWTALWVAKEGASERVTPASAAAGAAPPAAASGEELAEAGHDDGADAGGDAASEAAAPPVAAGNRDRIADRASADAVAERLRGRSGVVVRADQQRTRERPPQLYDLTTLQREANRRYKFSAAKTLEVAQRLYEQHKLLTYPRTDSRHISASVRDTLDGPLRALAAHPPWAAAAQAALTAGPKALDRRFVDDGEVTDHHAILPTATRADGRQLDADERRIYDLVAQRLLGAFAGDAVFATAWVVVAVGDDELHARGKTMVEAGWRAVDPPQRKAKDALLPAVAVGDAAKVERVQVKESSTRAPPHHTEASLLAAMERAGDELDDRALARAMKARGLGTPATRAAVVETLLKRGYIERKDGHLRPTPQGRDLLALLPVEALRSPQLTGAWEARLQHIADGREQVAAFRADVSAFTRELCATIAQARRAGAGTPARGGPDRPMRESRSKPPSPPGAAAAPPSTTLQRAPVGVEGAACPKCGGGEGGVLIRGKAVLGCSRWRLGCEMRLPWEIEGVDVAAALPRLLASGRSDVVVLPGGRRVRLLLRAELPQGFVIVEEAGLAPA